MTALITGASSGLGAEFARQLAARGDDLVLVARSADRLDALAAQLRQAHGVRVDVFARDLSEPRAPDRIVADLAGIGIAIDLLVNSAGFGTAGRFEEIPAGRDTAQLMVNVVSLVGLTRALVPAMLARGGGGVINVGSTAGFQPSPYFATYAAGKTFVLNFSLALRGEYRGRGLRVLALCPGPTRTAFFDTAGERAAIGGRMMPADVVVRKALRAFDRDKAYVVPGLGNAASAHLTPRRPRRLVTAIAKRVTRGVLEPA
ncbi:SDR family oxidoreductase [Phytohabitans sp. ZYX-F-186]|uniref:SDR family oxidoreductase n=1 Tax=Phytohabitans maris TaxID=3071409 RepID=A0ABU0ZSN1_9ACTN|nr:SDR family oxidoreductase [Phytohabitans sp. ZYX-F-186]MDQ7909985.1 SDR family oxidoreductase [Phytohabitans sp. ZYX-F-186]